MSAPNEVPPGMVKVTVYLSPEAWRALSESAEREGVSFTDTINLAVLAFDQLSAQPGRAFAYEGKELTS